MPERQYSVTWDNAVPNRNSDPLRKALAGLGQVVFPQTKTSALLTPRPGVTWKRFRRVMVRHLHWRDGNVFYTNLKTCKSFQRGSATNYRWKKV